MDNMYKLELYIKKDGKNIEILELMSSEDKSKIDKLFKRIKKKHYD
jgi:hypothetical protein